MRSSSDTPSSNSWLPTLETSTSMLLSVSMLGSSLNRPDIEGEAPIRSPAATVSECGLPLRRVRSSLVRYSEPPARTEPEVVVTVPSVPVGGSRWPW